MNRLVEWNNHLMGLPSGALLFIALIGLGYVLKRTHWFHNNSIPVVLMAVGLGLFLLVCPERTSDISLRNWWGRNILIGLIIPFTSWMAHRVVLKRIERKFGLFAANGDSDSDPVAFTKPIEPKL